MKNCLILVLLVITISFTPSLCEQHKRKENAITFNAFKGTLPNQIFKCMEDYSLLRCMKYFILVRIESQAFQRAGNLSKDFLEQILQKEKELPTEIPHKLLVLSENELNKRLTDGLQRYFKDRSITLRFIPSMLVKVVPSKDNSLEFSLKKSDKYFSKGRSDSGLAEQAADNKGGSNGIGNLGGKGGKNQYNHYLQLGLPAMLLPGLFFAGLLPMILPALKMATIFSSITNFSALLAAIMYLARQAAVEKEMQQTVYFNPGYKYRR